MRSRHWPLRGASLLGLILLWAIAALIASTPMLPAPHQVLASAWQHSLSGELPYHLSTTLARVLVSFLLAMGIGTAVGIAMGRYRQLDIALDGALVLGLNIPALVTIILCYIWFGLTEVAAVIAVSLNKIPTVVVTVREGARAVDPRLLAVAQAYRLPPWRKLWRVYLPQLYPYLMAAARGGLALIWKIVLVVELLGRSNGVGFQLYSYYQFFDITSILAYTLTFAAVVLLVEALIMRPLENRLTRWRNA
ncbi:ABC transporter permease [Litchfieldella anticariensis]|uniref:ABC transporter permease n=1 Tax=Litchfieldella anticariensis TaxID=258591 RepID=UPI0003991208|nr:ABC transporter permease [Halomonas anticariensis]